MIFYLIVHTRWDIVPMKVNVSTDEIPKMMPIVLVFYTS